MQSITPFLWFDGNAEEAMNFYVSVFKNSKVVNVSRSSPDGPVFSVEFQLNGQDFFALNGGPHYKFSSAISFFVNCETQVEVDHLWDKLSAGGEILQCGWLIDRFGLTWQIIPSVLRKWLRDPDPQKAGRVMQAMMKMKKIEIAGLKQAYEQP